MGGFGIKREKERTGERIEKFVGHGNGKGAGPGGPPKRRYFTLAGLVESLASRLQVGMPILPLAMPQSFQWAEIDLVGHFLTVANPVTQIHIGDFKAARLFNLPHDVIGTIG